MRGILTLVMPLVLLAPAAGSAADDLALWKDFSQAFREGRITTERIRPYYEHLREPLLSTTPDPVRAGVMAVMAVAGIVDKRQPLRGVSLIDEDHPVVNPGRGFWMKVGFRVVAGPASADAAIGAGATFRLTGSSTASGTGRRTKVCGSGQAHLRPGF